MPTGKEHEMADNTLSILKPSVNNLTARIFVRAAGLDFGEIDVWGKTREPEFLAKDPAEAATSGADDEVKAQSTRDAQAALAEPLDAYRAFFLDGRRFIGGDHPSIADIRLAATLEVLRAIDYPVPDWAE